MFLFEVNVRKNIYLLQELVTKLKLKFPPFVEIAIKMEGLNDKILKKFGEHIKDLRIKSGLSQDEVVLNGNKITKGTISDIENGKRNLSFTTLVDLAKGLKVHPKELLDFIFPTEI